MDTTYTITDLALSLDTVWMLLAAMLVFFMQPGFALVEAGFTRTKNTANILMKNLLVAVLGGRLRSHVRGRRVYRDAASLQHQLLPD